jgi:hypothetical protein
MLLCDAKKYARKIHERNRKHFLRSIIQIGMYFRLQFNQAKFENAEESGMKRQKLLMRGIVVMLMLVVSGNLIAVQVGSGTWVKAIPADKPNGNTLEYPSNDPNGWYSGPDATWIGPEAQKWYLHGDNGGIAEDGTGGWYDLAHYCFYNWERGADNPPMIRTIITGLLPGELYRVRVLYGVTSTLGTGGAYAGLDPSEMTFYDSFDGTDTGLWVPGRTGGDPVPSQEAVLGEVVAVGGQISVYVGPTGTTFYDGVSYELVTQCDIKISEGWALQADLNGDCYVNLLDFAELAFDWLQCMEPTDPLCEHLWVNP